MRRTVGRFRVDHKRSPGDGAGAAGENSPVRRAFVGGILGLGLGVPLRCVRAAEDEEKPGSTERPKPGDSFVFADGDKAGKPITLADIAAGGPPVQAWPVDSATKVVRDGSRLNQVVLLRLAPDELDEDTRAHAADGIVAYSAICAHAGCIVSLWVENAGKKNLVCPCHASTFDPRQQGEVLSGPAPRHLASLPVRISGGALTVSGPFIGKLGGAVSG